MKAIKSIKNAKNQTQRLLWNHRDSKGIMNSFWDVSGDLLILTNDVTRTCIDREDVAKYAIRYEIPTEVVEHFSSKK